MDKRIDAKRAPMRITFLLPVLLFLVNLPDVLGQNPTGNRKIKTITELKVDNKVQRIDHLILFSDKGQKTEEVAYFADGTVKAKTTFEYDIQNRCIKSTKYSKRGKIEKVSVFEYDSNGNKTKESIFDPEKRYHHVKAFEYTYY